MLTLYFAPGSSSMAVHIALHEVGASFEARPMSFTAATLHPARQRGLEHATAVWGVADQKLGNGWALGARYSIADIHLFRLYWRLFNSLKPKPGTFPNLDAHYARMMARPAVQKTIEVETAVGYELPA